MTPPDARTSQPPFEILAVAGARPNFMKIAPLMHAMNADPRFAPFLVHTGQHYDAAMSESFFRDLGIPEPDVNLGVGSGTHGEQTGRVLIEIEKLLIERRPDAVLVVGDVNSTLAATLAAVKLGIPVAHVEAGLRSRDREMPEEINRILTDSVSTWLFTTEAEANDNLAAEGVPAERDPPRRQRHDRHAAAQRRTRAGDRRARGASACERGKYAPAHAAPPEQRRRSRHRCGSCSARSRRSTATLPIVFPVHPRTRAALAAPARRRGARAAARRARSATWTSSA